MDFTEIEEKSDSLMTSATNPTAIIDSQLELEDPSLPRKPMRHAQESKQIKERVLRKPRRIMKSQEDEKFTNLSDAGRLQ